MDDIKYYRYKDDIWSDHNPPRKYKVVDRKKCRIPKDEVMIENESVIKTIHKNNIINIELIFLSELS